MMSEPIDYSELVDQILEDKENCIHFLQRPLENVVSFTNHLEFRGIETIWLDYIKPISNGSDLFFAFSVYLRAYWDFRHHSDVLVDFLCNKTAVCGNGCLIYFDDATALKASDEMDYESMLRALKKAAGYWYSNGKYFGALIVEGDD